MTTDDLTAAVARLREAASCCGHVLVMAADLRTVLSALETAQADEESACGWARDGWDSDTWATACGHYFTVNDGTPSDNEMHYCPFCAAKIDDTPDDDAIDAAAGDSDA